MALAKKAAINEPQAKKEVLAAAAPLVAIIFQGMNFKRLAPKIIITRLEIVYHTVELSLVLLIGIMMFGQVIARENFLAPGGIVHVIIRT